jgi:hypothetical protein
MRLASIAFAAAAILSSITLPAAPAFAWTHEEKEASACSEPAILAKISKRFHHQSHEVHFDRLRIEAYSKIHQHRYYPSDNTHLIARRYCGATASLSDGRRRTLWYFIETHQGFAGIGDNVEFCVSGFDRWNVYNAHCRVAR